MGGKGSLGEDAGLREARAEKEKRRALERKFRRLLWTCEGGGYTSPRRLGLL